MSLKRLSPVLALPALVAAILVVSDAMAGVGIADEPCPTVEGEHTNTCPAGNVGVPYTIQFKEAEGSGCGPGLQTFTVDSGTFPPGLRLSSEGVVSGIPTEAGLFTFYIKIAEPLGRQDCAGSVGEKRFTIPINPPLRPSLSITTTTVAPGTVGAPYSAALTTNLADAKTWSVSAGAMPPGLTLGATDGLITGTPTTAGEYTFTVQAQIDATSTASQSLTLVVRDALTITGPDDPALEVGVFYRTALKGNGGLRTYKWALTAGAMPPGLTFYPGGAITGRPTTAGEYDFTVTLTDSEGRTMTYEGSLTVADRLAVTTTQLKGKVGRVLRKAIIITFGGIDPTAMRLKRGPLPAGVRFDRTKGAIVGVPKKAGTWTIVVEVVDALEVKAKGTIVIVIAPGKRK